MGTLTGLAALLGGAGREEAAAGGEAAGPEDAQADGGVRASPAPPRWPLLGGWGRWAPGPRHLPPWLAALGPLGAAGQTEALLFPLPTFRAVPKGTGQQLGDLFADLAEELGAWPAGSEEGGHLWTGLHCFSRWLLWAPTGGLPAHTPPASERQRGAT